MVEDASEDPQRFEPGAAVLVAGEPAEVVERKRAGGRLVVRLDRPVARGAAREGPRDELPEPTEGEYYGGGVLGTVTEVAPGVANDVLELDTGLALPLVEACVREVDLERRRILVAPGFTPDH